MRSLLRILSLAALLVAVIAGVVDAVQSVSTSSLVLTQFGQSWFDFSPDSLNLAQAVIQRNIHPFVWDPVIQWILLQPTFAVFLALSLLLYLIAYKRKRPAGRFAAG